MKLSCTSVMLPDWTLDETFDRLASHGFQGVELRCRYNPDQTSAPSFWGRHLSDVSPDNIQQLAPAIRAAAHRSGLPVVALAPKAFVEDLPEVRKVFAGAVAIDAEQPPMVRLDAAAHDRTRAYLPQFDAARSHYERALKLAHEFGVKVLYEIHAGRVAVTCSRTAALLDGFDPTLIGAIYDVPNMSRVGLEDTRLGMEVLGPYLAHCHIGNSLPVRHETDALGAAHWKWNFASLQDGVADIAQIVADFQEVGYQGYLSLEDFSIGDADDKLAAQVSYLKHFL